MQVCACVSAKDAAIFLWGMNAFVMQCLICVTLWSVSSSYAPLLPRIIAPAAYTYLQQRSTEQKLRLHVYTINCSIEKFSVHSYLSQLISRSQTTFQGRVWYNIYA